MSVGAFAALKSLPAMAQRAAVALPRVGVLFPSNPASSAHLIEAFRQGLRERGFVDGVNVAIELRYGETNRERLSAAAAELVRAKVDVIVAPTDLAVQATRQHTTSIPVVMVSSSDPVGTGFVATLARPGGNITGLSLISPELIGKRLELIKEAVPGLSRAAFLWNPDMAGSAIEYKELESAGRRLHVQIQSMMAYRAEDIDTALAAIKRAHVDAIVASASNPIVFANRAKVGGFLLQNRLPSIFGLGEYVDAGALMCYGPDNRDLFYRSAKYVARILKGDKPSDLPVEQPTKFEMVINMKTAKALGIKFPNSILVRANRVIE